MASNESDEYSLWDTDGKIDQPFPDTVSVDIDSTNDGTTHTFSQFPSSAVDEEEEATSGDSSQLLEKKSSPIWSFEFYKTLFDVDTHVVIGRIRGSLIPKPSSSYTRNYIGGHPDLYGPLWICATLVMTIAMCGNLTTLFNHWFDTKYHYTPEFHRLVIATVVVYGYTFLIPLVVKGALFCAKIQASCSYLDILCLYGYSMFIFIPLSLLLLIPNCIVEWCLIAVAVCVSGLVILMSLWPSLREESKKTAIILLFFVFALHFAFALCFRLYFFSSITCSGGENHVNVTSTAAAVSTKSLSLEVNPTTLITSSSSSQ